MGDSNIFLTGFMGTGKSLVGEHLAELIKKTFVDTDQLLEEKTGKTISQLFTVSESVFRMEEAKVVAAVTKNKNQVVALGGGALLKEESRNLVLGSGTVVYMKASPDTLLRRLESSQIIRPLLLGTESKLAKIESLLKEREPVYKLAHITVETDGLTVDQVALDILKKLKSVAP